MYHAGRGVARDDTEASVWLRKAAEKGHAVAQYELGIFYVRGYGVAKDEVEAAHWIRKAAEQGGVLPQVSVGEMYQYGRGVQKDEVEAVRWFRKAADQGNARAQASLGYMYGGGLGVPRDDAEAVKWLRKAVEQGDAFGQANLGNMYEAGRSVPKDDEEAIRLYRKSAEQGHPIGQDSLGRMFEAGRGVTKDEAEAVRWYKKGAEQENVSAQVDLGRMYANGRGVAQDDAEAVRLYRSAAEWGFAKGQTSLGYMYETGRGVTKDEVQAMQWYRKAADQGDSTAKAALSAIESRRNADDLSRTIANLVKANEHETAVADLDPSRSALAHEILKAVAFRERLSHFPEDVKEGLNERKGALPPKMVDAILKVAAASFLPEKVVSFVERRLAETVDAQTLQGGLEWEHSDIGRHINRLTLEAEKPERRTALMEFVREFIRTGATANDARGRACAQADTLADQTDSRLPLLEALLSAGIMSGIASKGQALDMDSISRLVIAMRPLLREGARQDVLATCLFSLHDLSDEEFARWLEFLRSDSGGRYARAMAAALRDALLGRTEIFTHTMM